MKVFWCKFILIHLNQKRETELKWLFSGMYFFIIILCSLHCIEMWLTKKKSNRVTTLKQNLYHLCFFVCVFVYSYLSLQMARKKTANVTRIYSAIHLLKYKCEWAMPHALLWSIHTAWRLYWVWLHGDFIERWMKLANLKKIKNWQRKMEPNSFKTFRIDLIQHNSNLFGNLWI